MNKKGMAIGQVFIFMVAAITFAFILIFGFQAITGFLEKGETVEFFQFKTDIENSVKRIYSEYGAVRNQEFSLPMDYEQICFVDLDHVPTPDELDGLCTKDQIACDVWESVLPPLGEGYESADQNVFLKPRSPVAIKVFQLEISSPETNNGYLCKDIEKGKFTLRLEGRGSSTLIS